MRDPISPFSINCHSSIRWGGAVTVWFDPFRVENATGDSDVIFITHDHYDHFSPEDIRRVMKPDAVLVLPEAAGVLFPPPQADREMAVAKARASASAFFMFGSSL